MDEKERKRRRNTCHKFAQHVVNTVARDRDSNSNLLAARSELLSLQQRLDQVRRFVDREEYCRHKRLSYREDMADALYQAERLGSTSSLILLLNEYRREVRKEADEELADRLYARLFQETMWLFDNYPRVEWYRGGNSLRVHTEPVVLLHDGRTFQFGAFRLSVSVQGGSLWARAEALTPYPACDDSSVTHPHLRDNAICFGDSKGPAERMGENLALFDLVTLANQVLQTYCDRQPHRRLGEWDAILCRQCKEPMEPYYDDDFDFDDEDEEEARQPLWTECFGCSNRVCSNCLYHCGCCGDSRCVACLVECAVCKGKVCCGGSCDKCEREDLCRDCADDGTCSECRDRTCEACGATGESEVVCGNCSGECCDSCVAACDACTRDVCDGCRGSCGNCRNVRCESCLTLCSDCDCDLCDECEVHCESCNRYFCPACFGGGDDDVCPDCREEADDDDADELEEELEEPEEDEVEEDEVETPADWLPLQIGREYRTVDGQRVEVCNVVIGLPGCVCGRKWDAISREWVGHLAWSSDTGLAIHLDAAWSITGLWEEVQEETEAAPDWLPLQIGREYRTEDGRRLSVEFTAGDNSEVLIDGDDQSRSYVTRTGRHYRDESSPVVGFWTPETQDWLPLEVGRAYRLANGGRMSVSRDSWYVDDTVLGEFMEGVAMRNNLWKKDTGDCVGGWPYDSPVIGPWEESEEETETTQEPVEADSAERMAS